MDDFSLRSKEKYTVGTNKGKPNKTKQSADNFQLPLVGADGRLFSEIQKNLRDMRQQDILDRVVKLVVKIIPIPAVETFK